MPYRHAVVMDMHPAGIRPCLSALCRRMAESGAFSVGLTAKSRTGSADTNGGSGYLVSLACLYGFPFLSGNQNGTRQRALFATIAVPYVPHPPAFREEPLKSGAHYTLSDGFKPLNEDAESRYRLPAHESPSEPPLGGRFRNVA